jgi:hypothetical protein
MKMKWIDLKDELPPEKTSIVVLDKGRTIDREWDILRCYWERDCGFYGDFIRDRGMLSVSYWCLYSDFIKMAHVPDFWQKNKDEE